VGKKSRPYRNSDWRVSWVVRRLVGTKNNKKMTIVQRIQTKKSPPKKKNPMSGWRDIREIRSIENCLRGSKSGSRLLRGSQKQQKKKKKKKKKKKMWGGLLVGGVGFVVGFGVVVVGWGVSGGPSPTTNSAPQGKKVSRRGD